MKEEDHIIKGFHYEGKSWLTGAPMKSHSNAIEKVERSDCVQNVYNTFIAVPWTV